MAGSPSDQFLCARYIFRRVPWRGRRAAGNSASVMTVFEQFDLLGNPRQSMTLRIIMPPGM
jgi:hypothetical protein